jgi:LysM repeat protein
MQNQEYQIDAKDKLRQKALLYINSLLCILSLTLILMISCKSPNNVQYKYTVQSGDSYESISMISGISVKKIRSYNSKSTKNLSSGDILYLPGISKLKRGGQLQLLKVTTRAEWKAEKAESMKKAAPYQKITVHHTTDNPKYPKRNNALFVKVIQNYHQKKRKWADIAYHYLISKDGEIFEGRLLSNLGAHVKNHNTGNIGIALLGDFNRDQVPDLQKEALTTLIKALQERYDIATNQIFRHKDLGDTDCPGKHCAKFVQDFRSKD